MTKILTYEDCQRFFNECKAFWMRVGDPEGVATAKAFWWDFVECFNFDNSWNEAKEKFAMDFRGYKVGDPVPEAAFVEGGVLLMNVVLRKKIDFGKHDFFGIGRKVNACDVEIELRQRGGDGKPTYLELSICGNVWNQRHTDIVCGGQRLDEMATVIHDQKFKDIYGIWKKWHLNGMHAGTPEQEKKIEEWEADGNRYDYDAVCEMLKENNLYVVPYTGKGSGCMYENNPYRYGSGWLVRELPDEVVKFVQEVC